MQSCELSLTAIAESPDIHLSPGFRLYLLEAAQFCLDHNGHSDGAPFNVDGSYWCQLWLRWTALSQGSQHTFADLEEAAEQGAYGVAFMVILALTRHNVVERSAKGTGFDFWLGERGDLGFQKCARLEVSGILSDVSRISSRTAQKVEQIRRSDDSKLPAYVVIVEFSRPMSRVIKR